MVGRSLHNLLEEYAVQGLLTGTILIVDDELPNLAVLGSFLDGDYTVLEAESGSAALEIARTTPIDVVVCDQRMPGMTGVELLHNLREAGIDAPGIILTGYTDTPALIAAINDAHVFRFLRKPWQPEDVLAAVVAASDSILYQRATRRLLELLSGRTTELETALTELQSTRHSLLQLDRLVTTGRLAAGITHDLRNAMSSLVMVEYEVAARLTDPELVETIAVGLAGLRNLLESLETMNHYAKQKRLTMTMEYFDPARVVRDALTVMRMDLNFRARTVVVDAPREALPLLLGDRQKLVQVLVNLLRNAAQATSADNQIWVTADATDSGKLRFLVEDEGPGIAPEVRDRLFEAFASTKDDQGVGMGLYMSKLIVESHSGELRCLERVGGGARFEITIPPALLSD
jgi:signal transduction histidine kinase